MPDLDALIRAKLKEINEGAEYGNEQALGELLDAAAAVMELHKPIDGRTVEEEHLYNADGAFVMTRPKLVDVMCQHCDSNHDPAYWPCDTVEAVAKALGIQEG